MQMASNDHFCYCCILVEIDLKRKISLALFAKAMYTEGDKQRIGE